MRVKNLYVTRDNKQHASQDSANSHALANAHKELRELIDIATNNRIPESYVISQKIIMLRDARVKLESILEWIQDSECEEES